MGGLEASPAVGCALRENLWEIRYDAPVSYVETPEGVFEVDTEHAMAFQAIRAHCNPHTSADVVAVRSGVAPDDVRLLLSAADGIGLLCATAPDEAGLLVSKLRRVVEMWGGELRRSFLANNLLDDDADARLLRGWLLETYHYVRDFPSAIAFAAERTGDADLRRVLDRYVAEETGHESFLMECLVRIGFSETEVERSVPLVSTRAIGRQMRALFALHPSTVLLVAEMVEAQDFAREDVEALRTEMEERHSLPPGALAPYFEHQRIDHELRHHALFEDNQELFAVRERFELDAVVDALHDLKHAFDLQTLEMRDYYGPDGGRYVPRQPMTCASL